jgi:hypothetical protein
MGCLIALAAAIAAASPAAPLPVQGKPAGHQKAILMESEGPPGRGWTQRSSFRGTVTAIDQKSITILVPHGSVPLIFPFAGSFAEAKVPPGGHVNGSVYLPKDVRVGDRVAIMYADDGTRVECYEISILRRPGGRVPPGYVSGFFLQHHERMQAYQDWEEKGVAIPEKYRDKGRLDFLDPPYPPVAPMPREVPRKP